MPFLGNEGVYRQGHCHSPDLEGLSHLGALGEGEAAAVGESWRAVTRPQLLHYWGHWFSSLPGRYLLCLCENPAAELDSTLGFRFP